MNFWILAVAMLAIPAALISWPMFAGSARERMIGMLLLMMLPLAGLILYLQVGNPMALNPAAISPPPVAAPQTSVEDLLVDLQQRMIENPDDVEGWLILGRSLKTLRRYTEAETALANANRLVPGTPLVMVELAEARLFASGKPDLDAEMRQLIEGALEIDPFQQKGLWLLGMAAVQDGDDEKAIALWQKLLQRVDAASEIGRALTEQIETARERLGQDNIELANKDQPITGFNLPVSISLAQELADPLPETAVLFVFMHPTGQKGMPLAVKRIATPGFPVSLTFSDADMLRPGNSLKNYSALDISARISLTGVASKASGDLQSTPVKFKPNLVRKIALRISQRVP